ncbi:hypothetical protein EPN16_00400, partial [bacterium]
MAKIKNNVFSVLTPAICCLLSAFLFGCATAPSRRTAELPIEKFYINNLTYYPLASICEYFHIDWDYDSFGRQVSLEKSCVEVKLLIDSSMALASGSPLDIG